MSPPTESSGQAREFQPPLRLFFEEVDNDRAVFLGSSVGEKTVRVPERATNVEKASVVAVALAVAVAKLRTLHAERTQSKTNWPPLADRSKHEYACFVHTEFKRCWVASAYTRLNNSDSVETEVFGGAKIAGVLSESGGRRNAGGKQGSKKKLKARGSSRKFPSGCPARLGWKKNHIRLESNKQGDDQVQIWLLSGDLRKRELRELRSPELILELIAAVERSYPDEWDPACIDLVSGSCEVRSKEGVGWKSARRMIKPKSTTASSRSKTKQRRTPTISKIGLSPRLEFNEKAIEAKYLEKLQGHIDALVGSGHNPNEEFIPTEQLYVTLRGDSRSCFELEASEEMLKEDVDRELRRKLMSKERISESETIDRELKKREEPNHLPNEVSYRQQEEVSLEKAFREHLFLVIIGAPGSGKSVLCQQISRCLLDEWVKEARLAGDPNLRGMMPTAVGPTRLPIVIPVREYAKAQRDEAPMTLAEFLGWRLAKTKPERLQFGQWLLSYLKEGLVAVFLDGLDELPNAERPGIVAQIHEFISKHVRPTAFKKDLELNRGNRMVITSRIAGYDWAPIKDESFKLFTIKPFSEEDICKFCRNWVMVRFSQHHPDLENLTQTLIRRVVHESSTAVRGLCETPLLAHVICDLVAPLGAFSADFIPLPRSRAEIYQKAIHAMTGRWVKPYGDLIKGSDPLESLVVPGKMDAVLSVVARRIHEQEMIGNLTASDLRRLFYSAITTVSNKALPHSEMSRFTEVCMRLVETHAGVISAFGEGIYRFHHLTFQEFLAGHSLCLNEATQGWDSADGIAFKIATKVVDPRWREPALLAFGQLAFLTANGAPAPAAVLELVRRHWDDSALCLLEERANLIADLVCELPDGLIEVVVDQAIEELAVTYSRLGTNEKHGVLRERVIMRLAQLRRRMADGRNDGSSPIFDERMAFVLRSHPALVAPLAHIVLHRAWYSSPVMIAMAESHRHDRPEWGWPIRASLRRTCLERDWEPKVQEKFELPLEDDLPGYKSFGRGDITNLEAFANRLGNPARKDYVSRFLRRLLSKEAKGLLAAYHGDKSAELKNALVRDLDNLMRRGNLYDPKHFREVLLSPKTKELLANSPKGDALVRLNRRLLQDAYPNEIKRLQIDSDQRRQHAACIQRWREMRETERERRLPTLHQLPAIRNVVSQHMDRLRSNPAALSALIAICGGFQDLQCARWKLEYENISSFLQQSQSSRAAAIRRFPLQFIPRWGVEDPIYAMAVYLDESQEQRGNLSKVPAEFRSDWIVRDPSPGVARVFQHWLEGNGDRAQLEGMLVTLSKRSDDEAATEAKLALLAMGKLPEQVTDVHSGRLSWYLSRLMDELRDAVFRFSRRGKTNNEHGAPESESVWSVLDRWLPQISDDEAASIFQTVMQSLVEAAGTCVKPDLKVTPVGGSRLERVVRAEIWAAGFLGKSDDAVYNFEVLLDSLKFPNQPAQLLDQLEAIVHAGNFRFMPSRRDVVASLSSEASMSSSLFRLCHLLESLSVAAGLVSKASRSDFASSFFSEATKAIFHNYRGKAPMAIWSMTLALIKDGSENSPVPKEILDRLRSRSGAGFMSVPVELLADWDFDSTSTNLPNKDSQPIPNPDLLADVNLCKREDLSDSDGWKAFTIFAKCLAVQRSVRVSEGQDEAWQRIKEAAGQREADGRTKEALSQLLEQAGSSGLRLTEAVAESVETIAASSGEHVIDLLNCILPLLENPSATALPRLRTWSSRELPESVSYANKERIAEHAILCMAEQNGTLEPDWIGPLSRLALEGDERSSPRARLVLEGPILDVSEPRRFRLSALGLPTLIQAIDAFLEERRKGREARPLGRFISGWHIDLPMVSGKQDSDLLEKRGPARRLKALWNSAATWNAEGLESFAGWLKSHPKEWCDGWLPGYGRLLFYQEKEIPPRLHELFGKMISKYPPELFVLPEETSCHSIVRAVLNALSRGVSSSVWTLARRALERACRVTVGSTPTAIGVWCNVCKSIGESELQRIGTSPEDYGQVVDAYEGSEAFCDACFEWFVSDLSDWSRRDFSGHKLRTPRNVFDDRVTTALLCIMTVLTERRRDWFALRVRRPEAQDVAALLQQVVVHPSFRLAKMAAITLLSRIPRLSADNVFAVVEHALRSDPEVRERAVQQLPHFRELEAGKFVPHALELIKGTEPASVVDGAAQLLSALLQHGRVSDYEQRRQITRTLHASSSLLGNCRIIAHLAGTGLTDDVRHVVHQGRLDNRLSSILCDIQSGFSTA